MKTITALQGALIIAREELGPRAWLTLMIGTLLQDAEAAAGQCGKVSEK